MAELPASAISLFQFNTDLNDALGNASMTNSGVTLSNTQSKFGGYSGYFSSAHLTGTLSSTDIRTVAMWIYFSSYTSDTWPTAFCVGPNTDGYRGIYIHTDTYGSSTVPVYAVGNNANDKWSQLSGATSIPTNQWNHIAFTKDGTSTFRFFLNGTLQRTITNSDPVISNRFTIGGLYLTGVSNRFVGYIDEVLVATTAIWTAGFTPPTDAYVTYDKKRAFHAMQNQIYFGGL